MTRENLHRTHFETTQFQVRFHNTEGSEAAPPYGAMIVTSWQRDADRGDFVAQIRRCTEDDEKQQNHQMVLFNGRFGVQSGQKGYGTFSLPANAAIGGPALDPPAVEGGNSVPTSSPHEPQVFDTVGPVRGSWLLWRGGLTHTIRIIEIRGSQRYAIVGPNTSPGGWVEFTSTIAAASGATPREGVVSLLALNAGAFVKARGVSDAAIQVKALHAGSQSIASGKRGQIKLTSGKWAVDVSYC